MSLSNGVMRSGYIVAADAASSDPCSQCRNAAALPVYPSTRLPVYPSTRLGRLVRYHYRPQPLRRLSRHVAVRRGMPRGLHDHARADDLVGARADAVRGGLGRDRRGARLEQSLMKAATSTSNWAPIALAALAAISTPSGVIPSSRHPM